MKDDGNATVCVLEVAALRPGWTAARLREELAGLDLPATVVGELDSYPAVLMEVDGRVVGRVTERIATSLQEIEVVELRRHVRSDHLQPAVLASLISECAGARRVAVGAAAVERAMQRGRLELLVLATGLASSYSEMIRVVVEHNGYRGPLIVSELSRDELGRMAGVRRAGCVGVLRGTRHVAV